MPSIFVWVLEVVDLTNIVLNVDQTAVRIKAFIVVKTDGTKLSLILIFNRGSGGKVETSLNKILQKNCMKFFQSKGRVDEYGMKGWNDFP